MSIIGKILENAKKHNRQILEHNRQRPRCGNLSFMNSYSWAPRCPDKGSLTIKNKSLARETFRDSMDFLSKQKFETIAVFALSMLKVLNKAIAQWNIHLKNFHNL